MKHYYVHTGTFKIPLRQYLKQIGKVKHYDSIKKRLYRMGTASDADLVIYSTATILTDIVGKGDNDTIEDIQNNCVEVLADKKHLS